MSERRVEKERPDIQAKSVVVSLPVAIGILITTLTMCAGGFGTGVWWASGVSTKLEVLVKQGADQASASGIMGNRLTGLELWQRQVDAVGTPAMAKTVSELRTELEKVREDFNLHKATSMK